MSATVTIQVGCVWRQTEADGSACHCCGDVSYLNPVGLFVVIENNRIESDDKPACILCQSCADAAGITE